MKIKYCIPSYGRANNQKTLNYIKNAKVYICKEQYDEYIKNNPKYIDNFVICPDGIQGNKEGTGKVLTMNWILDNEMDDDSIIVFLDDDIKCLKRHKNIDGKIKGEEIDFEEFEEIIKEYSLLAKEWNIGAWGFNNSNDPLLYYEYEPFSLHKLLCGIIVIVKKDDIRFDKRVSTKEDVDFCLQHWKKYHKTLRVNKYYPDTKAFKGEGGLQVFRNKEKNINDMKELMKKWGTDVVRKKGIQEVKTILPFGGV